MGEGEKGREKGEGRGGMGREKEEKGREGREGKGREKGMATKMCGA